MRSVISCRTYSHAVAPQDSIVKRWNNKHEAHTQFICEKQILIHTDEPSGALTEDPPPHEALRVQLAEHLWTVIIDRPHVYSMYLYIFLYFAFTYYYFFYYYYYCYTLRFCCALALAAAAATAPQRLSIMQMKWWLRSRQMPVLLILPRVIVTTTTTMMIMMTMLIIFKIKEGAVRLYSLAPLSPT